MLEISLGSDDSGGGESFLVTFLESLSGTGENLYKDLVISVWGVLGVRSLKAFKRI